jgi:hypothetical protein
MFGMSGMYNGYYHQHHESSIQGRQSGWGRSGGGAEEDVSCVLNVVIDVGLLVGF